jgi:hypothetical protein
LPVVVVVALALVLVLALVDELGEEPPHAASRRLASITRANAAIVAVRLRLLLLI